MRVLSHLHEGPVLDGMSADERRLMREQLDDNNIAIARAMSPIMVLFVGLLWTIDFQRVSAGLLQASLIYRLHAAAHLSYAFGVLLSLLLWRAAHYSPPLRWRLLWAHVVITTGSVLLMGLVALVERHNMVLLGVAMMLGNLMYQVPRGPRLAFNAVALCAYGLTILNLDMEGPVTRLVQFSEMLALILVAAVVGGLHNRHRLASMLAAHRFQQMAMVDALTGVASRRRLVELLERELLLVQRGRRLSVVLLDIDRFKAVNDRHGHEAGDEVLRHVTRVLQQGARLSDVIGRWGGEEFLVVCTDTDLPGATLLADRFAQALRQSSAPVVGQTTASFGVAQALPGEALRELVARADQALYRAKSMGRDRVVADPAVPDPLVAVLA